MGTKTDAVETVTARLHELSESADYSTRVRGCSETDIAGLENHFGVKLPVVYKSFLSAMGRSGGDFILCDWIASYPDLIHSIIPQLVSGRATGTTLRRFHSIILYSRSAIMTLPFSILQLVRRPGGVLLY